jgi:6-phosphogluconolactonase
MRPHVTLAGLLVALSACMQQEPMSPTSPIRAESSAMSRGGDVGAVYSQTNAPSGNAVHVFARAADGALTSAGTYPTGGAGTGAGLGSQGAVTLSDDGRYLLAVNAGSNEVTAFAVDGDRLVRLNTVSSGGVMPISVGVHKDLAYVVNAGGTGNISGFRLDKGGLSPIAGSSRSLGSSAAGPAQISFTPDGDALVVTEKAANAIATYAVDAGGVAQGPTLTPSSGQTPFGFAFAHRSVLIVSEAFGGAPDASAASSYRVDDASPLALLSSSVPTTETAACWFVVTPDGKFAYTTNTGSGSVSGYRVGTDGRLTLLDADGRTGVTGAGSSPIDEAVSRNGRYLYVLATGARAIVVFSIAADGSLTNAGAASGLPAGMVGLAGM